MIRNSPRQAELPSYLTGRARVGEAFHASRTQIASDLGISESQACQFLRCLVRRGCVERVEGRMLRVLRRLEDDGVKEWFLPREKVAKKIRYVGYDPRETAIC